MGALEHAKKMSSEEIVAKIGASALKEYGLYHRPLHDYLTMVMEECIEEKWEPGIFCALNNADTDGILLEVLKADPAKIMEGVSIAGHAAGTDKKRLYLPDFAAQLAEAEDLMRAAKDNQIEVKIGPVDVLTNRGGTFIHIVTAANLSDLFHDCYEPGTYVSVNGASVKKVSCDTKIAELASLEGAKAVQIGYQYYTLSEIETATAADALNGVIRVLTDSDCMITETEKRILASRKQSCGKCVFCREGLLQLQWMHKEIADGKGRLEFLDLMKEIGEAMSVSTSCTMGQASPKAALTAIGKFTEEYEAHIRKKTCPAGVCFSTETYYINPKTCEGCGACMDVCPKDCIEGKSGYIHMIDEFDCDRCGKCMEVCEADAILKTSGKLPKLPGRLTKAGKFKR